MRIGVRKGDGQYGKGRFPLWCSCERVNGVSGRGDGIRVGHRDSGKNAIYRRLDSQGWL